MKKLIKAAAVIAAVISSLAVLAGCSKTITVTAKARGLFGTYWLCDGRPGSTVLGIHVSPCRKRHRWQVSRQEYDSAQNGQTVTISWP